VLPGNAAVVVLGKNATPAQVHQLEGELGLRHSEARRYAAWLGGMLHGDFGRSAVAVAEGRPDASISGTLASPLADSGTLFGYADRGVSRLSSQVTVAGEELGTEDSFRRARGRLLSYVPQNPGTSLNPSLRVLAAIEDMVAALP
jgi:hypothetical protein